jgi:SP family general alpha glucoside:H+ symporter-like MFS transporter
VLNELRADQLRDAAVVDLQGGSSASLDKDIPVTTTVIEITKSTFGAFLYVYENRIYPVVSLLSVRVLREEAAQADISPISRQLIFAFCAYVINFGNLSNDKEFWSSQSSLVGPQTYYLDHALLCQDLARVTQPDPRSVYISFFLYGAHAGQGEYRQAWFYLREATTLFSMLRGENQGWYDEKTRRRLFWILVVSER